MARIAHRLHTRLRQEAFFQNAIEFYRAGLVVTLELRRQPRGDRALGRKAWIDVLGVAHAAHRKTGADQKQERQRHLGDHQAAAQPALGDAARRAARLVAQRRRQIGASGFEGRRQTEEKRRHGRRHEGESEHSIVERQTEGQIHGQRQIGGLDQPIRQQRQGEPQTATEKRQSQIFEQ